jgi:hypothetical protein
VPTERERSDTDDEMSDENRCVRDRTEGTVVAKRPAMRTLRFSVVALCSLLTSSAALLHCSSDDSATNVAGDDSGVGDGARDSTPGDDGAPHDAGVTSLADASLTPFCKVALASSNACGYPVCNDGGAKYAALCDALDTDINSVNQSHATIACETDAGDASCDQFAERDCEDNYFRASTATAAGMKLAADYCATCEPSNGACTTQALSNLDGGESFIFGDAWGLSDTVATAVDTHCTGAALAQDAGTCAESYYTCSQNVLFTFPSFVDFADCP